MCLLMTLENLEKRALTLGIRMKPQYYKILHQLIADENKIDYVISTTSENIKNSLKEKHFKILHHDGTLDKCWKENEETFLGVYEMYDGHKTTYVLAFPKGL